MDEQIIGHQKQREMLRRAIEKNKVAHAYIFVGPNGVGKKTVALNFARKLLVWPETSAFHPDFLFVDGTEGIKIESIRDLIYKFSLKPYQAKYKVAILDQAENMTSGAYNALLKALEEPKPDTVIVLVSSSVERLPKTIISRAQKITFGMVTPQQIETIIPKDLPKNQKDLIISVAAGRPGWAQRIVHDPDYLAEVESFNNFYEIFVKNDKIERLLAAEEIAGLESAEIKSLLDFWLVRLEQELGKTGLTTHAQKLRQVGQSRRLIEQNLNAKLVLTELMIQT